MLDWVTNIVALVINPVSLLIFLVAMRYLKKEQRKKGDNPFWLSHQGKGA